MNREEEEEEDLGEITHELVKFKNGDSARHCLHSRMRENDICRDETSDDDDDFTNVYVKKDVKLEEIHAAQLDSYSNVVAQFCIFQRPRLDLHQMRHNRDYGFPEWKLAFLSKSRTEELRRRKRVKPAKREEEENINV